MNKILYIAHVRIYKLEEVELSGQKDKEVPNCKPCGVHLLIVIILTFKDIFC